MLKLSLVVAITISLFTVSLTNFYPPSKVSASGAFGTALRFYGNGTGDIDRVKVQIDPATSADIGAGNFTIEFWLKDIASDNSTANCNNGNDAWINGNVIIDRDIFGPGNFGDYGISLMNNGRIAFGINNSSAGYTICGTTNVADGSWHHIAVTRRISDGQLSLFVDGTLQAQADGPDGNISYEDGRSTSYPNSDPYLVIGAEKHDVGPAYPSFNGTLDELRLSNNLRYTANFTRPAAPFTSDANTMLLFHFDENLGAGNSAVTDASGNINGSRRYGGTPAGPIYVDSDISVPCDTGLSSPAVVYRFWSDRLQGHFYTISECERNDVQSLYATTWSYEGARFRATLKNGDNSCPSGSPVYRFWSDRMQGHFYTISLDEKNTIEATYPTDVWLYERVAYCANITPTGGTTPLYRFWSDSLQSHFYTIDQSERDDVIANYPTVWKYEGVAYYVNP